MCQRGKGFNISLSTERAEYFWSGEECNLSEWIIPPVNQRMETPDRTLFIVIDVSRRMGAVRIAERSPYRFIETVGTESQGLVRVSWDKEWVWHAHGFVRVKFVMKKM